MRLPVDDEIYNVDAVWLGPPGKTLPFRARYVAYAVGAVIFLLLQIVERRLGIGIGFFSLAYGLLITVGLTRLILTVVDHDRSVLATLQSFLNELRSPRDVHPVRKSSVRPGAVAAVPLRMAKHGRREGKS